MYDEIIFEVDDPVATITLNRPEAMNAWTDTIGSELRDAMQRADDDPAVVGIVVTGAGRAFCAGADMNALQSLSSSDRSPDEAGLSAGAPASPSLESTVVDDFGGRLTYPMALRKPVIAAVNGAVAGMAYPFSLSCDLRFGTEKSLFVTAFAQRGLIAEWGLSWLLPRLVGPSTAIDLLLSSRRVYGEEARALGLLDRLVAPDDLLDTARGYVEDLARTSSPASMAVMKRQVHEQFQRGLGAAELDSRRLMAESFGRPDFREGVASFVDKRDPEFPRIGTD